MRLTHVKDQQEGGYPR